MSIKTKRSTRSKRSRRSVKTKRSRSRGVKPSDITRRKSIELANRKLNKKSMKRRNSTSKKMTIYEMKPIPRKKTFVSSFAKKAGGYLSPHSTKQTWLLTLPRKKSTTEKLKKLKYQLSKR